jgi:hypothetical protein
LWRLPQKPWVRLLGNVEGWIGLACTVVVLLAPTTSADRFNVRWLWIGLWAVGMGAGVGGLRFGHPSGRLAGGIAVTLLGAALLLLMLPGMISRQSGG